MGFFDGHGGGGCGWGILAVVVLIDSEWQIPARLYEGGLVCWVDNANKCSVYVCVYVYAGQCCVLVPIFVTFADRVEQALI